MVHSARMRRWLAQILNELRAQYIIPRDPSIAELENCSKGTVATLSDITKSILAASPILTPSTTHTRAIKPLRSPRGSSSPKDAAAVEDLLLLNPPMSLAASIELLESMRESARAAFHAVHHSEVQTCHRRLFTDASILLVLARLQGEENEAEERGTGAAESYKALVGILDQALVIANAPGPGRMDMCHDAIAYIQEEYIPITSIEQPSTSRAATSSFSSNSTNVNPNAEYPDKFEDNSAQVDAPRASKRPKRATRGNSAMNTTLGATTQTAQPDPIPLPSTSSQPVPRLPDPPTLSSYKSTKCEKPFIISRYASDWPALTGTPTGSNNGKWSSPRYLRVVGGLGRMVPVEVSKREGGDYMDEGWTTEMMDWEEFLDGLYDRSAWSSRVGKAKLGANAQASSSGAASSSRPGTPAVVVDPAQGPRKRGRPPNPKSSTTSTLSTRISPRSAPTEVDSQQPQPSEEYAGPTYYLAQHSLITQFPELRPDIIIPDYVYSVPPIPSWYSSYRPPRVEDEYIVNNWIGPRGSVTPAHKDPYYNCYVQVVGKKTVWLAPPDFDEEMYPYHSLLGSGSSSGSKPSSTAVSSGPPSGEGVPSSESSPGPETNSEGSSASASAPTEAEADVSPAAFKAGLPLNGNNTNGIANSSTSNPSSSSAPSSSRRTPDQNQSGVPSPSSTQISMDNTSSVPIFSPAVDGQHPLFFDKVVKHAMSAVLEPGDMLVFPPGWWHAMRAEETSISVSIWF